MEFKGRPGKLGWKLRKRLLSISDPQGAVPSLVPKLQGPHCRAPPAPQPWHRLIDPLSPSHQHPPWEPSTPVTTRAGPAAQPSDLSSGQGTAFWKDFLPGHSNDDKDLRAMGGHWAKLSYLSKAIKLQGRHCRAPRVSLHTLTVQARQSSAKSTHAFLIAPKNNNIKMTSRQPPSPALPTSINQLAKQILLFC